MLVGHSEGAATGRLVLAISAAVETLLGRRRGNIAVALEPAIRRAVARWERDWRLERQREGIAKAKAAGKYRGRKPSIDVAEIRRLSAKMGPAAIAKRLGISRSSVYRLLATSRRAPAATQSGQRSSSTSTGAANR